MGAAAVPIGLWVWPLDCDAAETARRRQVLSPDERDRADRFVHGRDRVHFTSARWRLREILADLTGVPAQRLAFAAGPRGKPLLPGGPVFNLSHSAGMAALAVTADPEVWLGVDIEGARAVDPGLDDLAFAPEERAALRALDPARRADAFFLGWTRKEAVVKATGQGLYADLAGFAVTLDPDLPARVTRFDGQNPAAWRICDFRPRADIAGAIAAMTGGRDIAVTRHD